MRRSRSKSASRTARLVAPAAAAAAAVLLLGACSSDSEGDSGDEDGSGEEQQSGGSSGGEADSGEGGMDGTWTTGLEEPYNVLVFADGTASFMQLENGETSEACTGPAVNNVLALVCPSGDSQWTEATVSLEGETLNVNWRSGTEESYQRADDAAMDQLPEMPDMPDMEDLEQNLPDFPDN
jgi:hypothetical protein